MTKLGRTIKRGLKKVGRGDVKFAKGAWNVGKKIVKTGCKVVGKVGTAAGAAIGSVVPGVGTALGATAGATAQRIANKIGEHIN